MRFWNLGKKKAAQGAAFSDLGAGNETRTRDPDLGKVVLYQLSYSRMLRRDTTRRAEILAA